MSQRVFVAMSGGVDSAAAALLLRQAGYNVTGVTLRLHPYKDRPGLCGSADDIETARAVAAGMGIPHVVLDLCDLFRERVMDRFVWAYTHGRTPNPCIDCNREIKFGALLDWALDQGADAMATGHYARVRLDTPSGRWQLLRGADRRKDQTYFLYQLTQHQLAHLLLPVGDYEKPALRALAAANGLSNAQKADSQDICFVPDGDYVSFLRQYGGVEPVPGDFLDSEGRVLGRHRGMECYTIGQRKGLGLSGGPWFVIKKDIKRNIIYVSNGYDPETQYGKVINMQGFDFITEDPWGEFEGEKEITFKIRHTPEFTHGYIRRIGDLYRVESDEKIQGIAPGQYSVIYDKDHHLCLGSGMIIDETK